MMPFICDIIKIWEFFGQLRLILSLFEHILLLVPTPRLIYFSKVLNNQSTCFNSFRSFTEYTKSFRMNSKMFLHIFFDHLYSRENYLCYLFIKFTKSWIASIFNYILKCNSDVIASFSLLLNCKNKFFLDKLTLKLRWDVLWKEIN